MAFGNRQTAFTSMQDPVTTTDSNQTLCATHGLPMGHAPVTPTRFKKMRKAGLYDPAFERDACGVGMVANIDGSDNHKLIEQALEILVNLGHRGATGSDPETGDGAGILIQTPHSFFKRVTHELGFDLPEARRYGVGMMFLPREDDLRSSVEAEVVAGLTHEGLSILGWRDVPTDPTVIGYLAREVMPVIRQVFIVEPGTSQNGDDGDAFERRLYIARKEIERRVVALTETVPEQDLDVFYVCSLSSRTVVYKGLIMTEQLEGFFPDLREQDVTSAFALVHSRFSTNTLGEWKLAHPYRYLCHNGEINTVRGNRNWMAAREQSFTSDVFGDDVSKLAPVNAMAASDTASLDEVFELLNIGGRSVEHVAAMMIPESWYGHESMSQSRKDFYEYHGGVMEPWDGPALIAFTDGRKVGAVLDRNGLRPFRYYITKDGLLVMSSETGVLEIEPDRIAEKRRLEPGRMFLLDLEEGRIVGDDEIKDSLADQQPYGEWLDQERVILDELPDVPAATVPGIDLETLVTRQQAFGYTQEDLRILIEPMGREGAEGIGSMGNDTPLAVLSDRPQPLFTYFKQLFAQVSNPP
ncbi:MAG TPA: glutamate synthase subunit alpha, partial [Dehalococcoidia bacterium]|nr:glutamate synthase subunit alpha [Dehalococcoidia bacterium]